MARGPAPLPALSPALFVKAGEALFGDKWQVELAKHLGVRDQRNIYKMSQEAGHPEHRSIRLEYAQTLAALVATRKRQLREVEQALVSEIAAMGGDDYGIQG